MPVNSQAMIKDIRTDFEKMLDYVTGEEARTATADQIERGLFKLLIALGAKLLTLFFVTRSQASSRQSFQQKDGQALPYHRDTPRHYFSIFGKIAFWRPYFYKKGRGGHTPLDEALSLGDDCYSDLVREVAEYLGVYSVHHTTRDILDRLLGLQLSTRVVAANVAEDAADVEAYYAQKPPPVPAREAEILVIQADGKGVPIILEETSDTHPVRLGKGEKRGHKKEAVVTGVYTIGPAPRTPEEVLASFFKQEPRLSAPQTTAPRARPQNKQLWATLEGKDTALARLAQQVAPRQGSHIQHKVALCDGCEALQSRIARQFPDFSQVLDFIHANEYVWDVANSLLGETHAQRIEWMQDHTLRMLSGQTEQLIAEFRHLAQEAQTTPAQKAQLKKTADYFERNLAYMDYPTCLAKGWPIASGVIEGACRHFVKDRCELSGMRWRQPGAENLLRLRAVAENEDWEAYHTFRKRRRHTRLYGSPWPVQDVLEMQSLDPATFAGKPSQGSACQSSPVPQSTKPSHDHELPLAA
jgi:hypothetical protein